MPTVRTSSSYVGGGRNKFYQSKEWRTFRAQYLAENPLCRICDEHGRTAAATVVDHIQPISQGGSVWGSYNLQGLCKTCNAKKTALDNPNNQ